VTSLHWFVIAIGAFVPFMALASTPRKKAKK
jgi:hypothetical protein